MKTIFLISQPQCRICYGFSKVTVSSNHLSKTVLFSTQNTCFNGWIRLQLYLTIRTFFVGESDPRAATATVCKTITVEHTSCVNGGANQEFWMDK